MNLNMQDWFKKAEAAHKPKASNSNSTMTVSNHLQNLGSMVKDPSRVVQVTTNPYTGGMGGSTHVGIPEGMDALLAVIFDSYVLAGPSPDLKVFCANNPDTMVKAYNTLKKIEIAVVDGLLNVEDLAGLDIAEYSGISVADMNRINNLAVNFALKTAGVDFRNIWVSKKATLQILGELRKMGSTAEYVRSGEPANVILGLTLLATHEWDWNTQWEEI